MIGDMPPPPPPLLGWRWPRGPLHHASKNIGQSHVCLLWSLPRARLVVRNEDAPHSSAAILSAGAVSAGRDALRPTARRRRVRLSGHARIPNDAMDHEPVPDEQHDERAERRGDETGTLIGPVPADGLADKGGDEGAGDTQRSGQDEAFRLVRTRRNHARN